MPLVLQPDGTVAESPIAPSGTTVLVLDEGQIKEAFVQTGAEEVSFPSYISATTVYTPSMNLEQAGVSLINGRVVLDTIIKEVAGNV